MNSIGTREIIGAAVTLLMLPLVFFVVGIGLFWLFVIIPVLFILAILLLRVQIWMAKGKMNGDIVEGHSVVIEERLIEKDED